MIAQFDGVGLCLSQRWQSFGEAFVFIPLQFSCDIFNFFSNFYWLQSIQRHFLWYQLQVNLIYYRITCLQWNLKNNHSWTNDETASIYDGTWSFLKGRAAWTYYIFPLSVPTPFTPIFGKRMHVISTPVLLDFSKIFPLNDDSFYFRTLHLSACHLQVLWILLHHRKYSEPSCFYIMLIALAPSDIRFMQDSIHHSFYGGGRVNDVIDQICYRHTSLNNIPTIEVTNRNGKYYSLDNRRLYLYRVLEKRGFLFRITVFLVSRWDERKFTTLNDGASIFVRGDTTFPHAIEETKKPLENLAETLR